MLGKILKNQGIIMHCFIIFFFFFNNYCGKFIIDLWHKVSSCNDILVIHLMLI